MRKLLGFVCEFGGKEPVKEIDNFERGRLCGVHFLHNTKSSSVGGTKKLYWRRVLGSLGGFT